MPEELAIVGYDNSPVAALPLISLSTVDQDGPEFGARAAATLLSRLDGRTDASHEIIAPRFVARSSC